MAQRRRYLSRRVAAQREGHGGFYREGGGFPGTGVAGLEKSAAKATEARLAEFRVRTDIHNNWYGVKR